MPRYSVESLRSLNWILPSEDVEESGSGEADITLVPRWCRRGPIRPTEDVGIENLVAAISAYSSHINELAQSQWKLTLVERLLGEVRTRLSRLEERQVIVVPVETLEPEPYTLRRPLSVVVEPVDAEFVATFYDANVSASGETAEDAVTNFKDVLIATFEFLQSEENLGAALKKQKRILETLLQPR
jgi:predicted RNase H-like HicB family nuclease